MARGKWLRGKWLRGKWQRDFSKKGKMARGKWRGEIGRGKTVVHSSVHSSHLGPGLSIFKNTVSY
jgi:hypothetical protein